jgi:DNA gyrase/topoisomerase IV subunit A
MEFEYSDLLKLAKNTNHNIALIKRLLNVFRETMTMELSVVQEFVKYASEPNYSKLEPHFHKMKSGLSYIAKDEFLEEYMKFYEDLVQKKYLLVKNKIPVIIEKLQGLVKELEQLSLTIDA